MEADLSRYHRIRYSDRWRFDEDGCRRLTVREIWVRIQELPPTSRIVKHYNDGKPRWTDNDYILSHIWQALTRKKYPLTPKPPKHLQGVDRRETPERAAIRKKRIKAKRNRELAGRKGRGTTE
ncbi:hypothetical protein CH263_13505 [Rhodococcus sp. 06-1059B-a]|nr:hypothetical protein [Rhodococcus sp. 06-1059B-a]OZD65154.1 hypothetical protein CH263_13505 [Rhodococcus sp. 06-1059B-a]